MKTFSCIILCSLLVVGSMLFAGDWYGFYGYVYEDGEPVEDATIRVWEHPGGESEYSYTNEYGYYQHACPRGWYGMEAYKGSKNDIQFPVYNNGQAGGVQVDFNLGYEPK